MPKIKIWGKLFILLFSFGIISTATTVYWGFHNAKSSLESEALAHLISIRDIKKSQIVAYFLEKLADTEVVATDPALVEHLEELSRLSSPAHDFRAELGKNHELFQKRFHAETESTREKMGFYDIFLIDKEGNVIHTLKKGDDLGTNLISGKYNDTALAKAFAKGMKAPSISDMEFYKPSFRKISSFFAAPVKNKNGDILGVLATQIVMDIIDEIMQARSGLGETGETFLIGDDLLLRSDSRFFKEKTVLKRKIDREAPQRAIAGKTGTMLLLDYRDVPVLNAYAPLNIPGLNWGIIAKMDEEELLAPIYSLRKHLFVGTIVLTFVIFLVSYIFSKKLTQPIVTLDAKLSEISRSGNYGDSLPIESTDEIGSLITSFNEMSLTIHERTSELKHELSQRKQAEETLRESETRFRGIFENAAAGVAIASIEGKWLQVNQHLSDMLGYTKEELTSKTFMEITHPDDQELDREYYEKTMSGKLPKFTIEKRYLSKSGEVIWVLVNITMVTDVDNRPLNFIALVQDITARKKVEENLQERTNLIQLLQEIAVTVNEASTVEEAMRICLEKVCAYTGWPIGHIYMCDSREVLLPANIWHMTNPVKFKKFMEITAVTTFTSGEGLPGRVLRDGRPHWIVDVTKDKGFLRSQIAKDIGVKGAFAFPVLEGERVAAVLEFFSEETADPDELILEAITNLATQIGRVTERKRAEEALKKSELWFRSTFESLEEAVFVVTPDRRVVNVNRAASIMFGYSVEEFKGLSTDIVHVDHDHYVQFGKLIKESFDKNEAADFEFELKRKDGEIFPSEHTVSLLRDEDGNPLGIVSVVRDITERKRAEEEIITAKETAEKANRLKTQFIATTNHELRGPLQTIIGYLKLILENKYDNRKEETEFLKSAYISSIHLKGLITDLLDISAIESDKIKMTLKSVSLPAVFTQVNSVTSMLAKDKKLELNFNMDCPCLKGGLDIHCDPVRLQQALVNLVGNAIKFTEKGSVSVYCESVPGNGPENNPKNNIVKIYVKDTGIGIAPDGPDIFEPFVQIDGPAIGGTGLGLSIAKKLVEKMGGTLKLTSKGLGYGTTTIITMPVSPDQENQHI